MKMSLCQLPIHWPSTAPAVQAFFLWKREISHSNLDINFSNAPFFKIDRVEDQRLKFLNNISID
jgi:hypothetical protein